MWSSKRANTINRHGRRSGTPQRKVIHREASHDAPDFIAELRRRGREANKQIAFLSAIPPPISPTTHAHHIFTPVPVPMFALFLGVDTPSLNGVFALEGVFGLGGTAVIFLSTSSRSASPRTDPASGTDPEGMLLLLAESAPYVVDVPAAVDPEGADDSASRLRVRNAAIVGSTPRTSAAPTPGLPPSGKPLGSRSDDSPLATSALSRASVASLAGVKS